MLRRFTGPILAAACLLAAFGGSTPAYACTIQDPTDCPTYTVTHHAVLTVATPSRGSITSSPAGIACPGDCTEDYTYEDFCTNLPGADECEPGTPTDVTLTAANGGAGYAAGWSGCDSATGSTCTLTMETNRSASLTWTDVANPSVALSAPPAKAGPSTTFTATATDNSGVVTKVDFYVDNVLRLTDTSAPYQYSPDLSPFADGSSHTLKVVAQDVSGRASSDLTSAPSATFTVDKSTGLTGVTTPAAYSQTAPAISFTTPSDATVVCRTKFGGNVSGTTSNCASPYSPQGAGTDGAYTVELLVSDDVGNTATITRSFTKDTGAPNLTVGSPASGGILTSPFTPSVTVADGFTPTDQITLQCQIDAGPFGGCDSLAPAAGTHALTVRATDLAGNVTQQAVAFTYGTPASAGSPGDGSGGDPGSATPGGGSGPVGGGPSTPTPAASKVKLASAFKLIGVNTLVTKLTLQNLAKGAKVVLSCKGSGCAFKKLTLTSKAAQLALVSRFKKRKLAPKAVITVVVTSAGKSQTFRYTVRKKRQPKVAST